MADISGNVVNIGKTTIHMVVGMYMYLQMKNTKNNPSLQANSSSSFHMIMSLMSMYITTDCLYSTRELVYKLSGSSVDLL